MDEDWRTVEEDYLVVQPTPPRFQNQISEKQAIGIQQMTQDGQVALHAGDRGELFLQVGSRVVDLRDEGSDAVTGFKLLCHASEKGHAVAPPGTLGSLGKVRSTYRYEFEQLRPRSFGRLKGLAEEEAEQAADDSSQEVTEIKDKGLQQQKSKPKVTKKQKDAAKAVSEFTAKCLKDLKRKLIRENALRKTTRAKKMLLLKGKRARVVRIEVENVNNRG